MNVLGVTVFSGTACFVVEAATRDDPWPIRIQTFFSRLWDLRTLVFVEMCFLSWHVTPMSGNRISIHGTNRKHEQYLRVRSGEVVFYAIVHVVINTTSTLCSFVCTKLICYVHNSCA